MTMEQFIVYAVRMDNNADYREDHYECIEKVFSTREKAEEYALARKAKQDKLSEGLEEVLWFDYRTTWTVEEIIVY